MTAAPGGQYNNGRFSISTPIFFFVSQGRKKIVKAWLKRYLQLLRKYHHLSFFKNSTSFKYGFGRAGVIRSAIFVDILGRVGVGKERTEGGPDARKA